MTSQDLETVLARFRAESVEAAINTPRYRMTYHAWGSGPALIIIHGLNDIPRSFVPLMASLQSHCHCIAIALPDGYRDGAVLQKYGHEHFTSDVIDLLDRLALDRADVLGSSFGSTIAIRTAVLHPQRIGRIVLQGGFARRPLNPVEYSLAHLGRSWPWRMGDLPIRPRVMRRLEAPAFIHAPDMLPFLLKNSAVSPIRAVTHRARILIDLDLRPMLPDITQPMLMLGGDRDAIVPRRFEAEVETFVRNVRRIEFSPCGHYPQYTHPQAMADAIRNFLASPRK